MNRLEDLVNATKLNELINKNEEKKDNTLVMVLAVVGGIALVAGIAYALYRYFKPDYLEDFEDEFDYDDFDDDDFFEDDEEDFAGEGGSGK